MLYVSIDPHVCPINVAGFMLGLSEAVSHRIPGLKWEIGYIDNADHGVGE
jgi:hypothetical protein